MQYGGDLPEITSPVFIGILVAITGNILISLALNLQKLAHKRVEADTLRRQRHEDPIGKARRRDDRNVDADGTGHGREQEHLSTPTPGRNVHDAGVALPASETESLLPFPISSQSGGYGARDSTLDSSPSAAPRTPLRTDGKRGFASRSVPGRPAQSKNALSNHELDGSALLPADVIIAGDASHSVERRHGRQLDVIQEGNETDYLKSKMWYVNSLWPQICTSDVQQVAWFPAHECR